MHLGRHPSLPGRRLGIGMGEANSTGALQIGKQHAGGGSIAAAVGETSHPEDPDGVVEPDRDDIAELDPMARRRLAGAVDANMAGLDQRSRAAAGFYHPRVPQPFIKTLAFQSPPISTSQIQ